MKIAVSVLAGLVVALAIALGVITSGMQDDIGSQGARISQLTGQVASEQSQLSAAQTRLQGQRQDVITCNDLRQLQMAGIDSAGDQVSVGYDNGGGPNAVSLPGHCYNP